MKLSSKIILFILGSLLVAGIGAMILFNDEKENSEIESIETEQQNNFEDNESNGVDETEENNETDEANGLVYWINSKKWSNKTVEDIKIFNDKISLPVNLENLDICSAPYSFWPNGVNPINNIEKIENILKSDEMMDEGEVSVIGTQTELKGDVWHDEPDNIGPINIKNYSDKKLSVAECYNNGWWYINNQYVEANALGIDVKNLLEYDDDWNEMPVLDGAIEKNGNPTFVWVYKGNLENKDYIEYALVYERDEYVVTISASEMIMGEYYVGKIEGMMYYTKESWEKEHSDIIVSDEITKNGMKIQFVEKY